jgi:hypothetical protein
MIKIHYLLLIAFLIFILVSETELDNKEEYFSVEKDGFDLRYVDTLTFQKNKYTNGRRTKRIPQLNCVGGNACDESNIISSVQCKNTGLDENENVQWKCDTKLPLHLRLSKTNVNCEGLKNNTDKIKLKGSCGLEYDLDSSDSSFYNLYSDNIIFGIIFLIVVSVIICVFYRLGSHRFGYYGHYPYSYPYPYYTSMPYIGYQNYGYNWGDKTHGFELSSGYGSTITR